MAASIGCLRKMKVDLSDPVTYNLRLDDQEILLNDCLDKKINLVFLFEIYCIQCGRKTNKSFQQGFCFPCMRRLQECDLCMIHPERCHVEQGTCPKDDWAHAQCYQSHVIYLANSSGLKVGITRTSQIPTRWIDQGAKQALAILTASNRYQAGVTEVALKQYINDKTNWRAMLKNSAPDLNLMDEWQCLQQTVDVSLMEVIKQFSEHAIEKIDQPAAVPINYPVLQYPEKVSSLSFDKSPEISGRLLGIKGQYLILDSGVLNIRKFGGYRVSFSVG